MGLPSPMEAINGVLGTGRHCKWLVRGERDAAASFISLRKATAASAQQGTNGQELCKAQHQGTGKAQAEASPKGQLNQLYQPVFCPRQAASF